MPHTYFIEDMQSIARHYGGRCLSKEYINAYSPLKWMCKKGHTWDSTYIVVGQGGWCRQCLRQTDKLKEFQEIARQRGGRCLSNEYINKKTKLQWQCSNGHVWMSTPHSVKHDEAWCRKCAGTEKRTIEEMRELAASCSGSCLSTTYKSNKHHLTWQCAKGHKWQAKPNPVIRGTWCPYCARTMKGNIKEMQLIARQRGGKCLSLKYINANTPLKWQCAKGHQWRARPCSVKSGNKTWCPFCAHTVKGNIKQMQLIARQRGGKCLSLKYINSITPLQWQCAKGHTWQAIPGSLKNGTWCYKCSLITRSEKQRMDISVYKNIAISRGGKLISNEHINSKTHLQWRCSKGHVWSARPGNIKNQNNWCPYCAGMRKQEA